MNKKALALIFALSIIVYTLLLGGCQHFPVPGVDNREHPPRLASPKASDPH